MLPDLNVPLYWPAMVKQADESTDQGAIKALANVRAQIVRYRHDPDDPEPWREHHAKTAPIVDVVAGLIADATVIDELHESADARAEKLAKENERLCEELAESKRPYTAQMTMLNRRIIDLNEKLLEAEMKLEAKK